MVRHAANPAADSAYANAAVRCTRRPKGVASLLILAGKPLLFSVVASLTRMAYPQQPGPSQTDVQAVYLFDFAKFVRWPAGTEHETLTICVDAPRAYVDTLTRIVAGERIEARPLAVRELQGAANAAGCGILFIDAAAQKRLGSLLAATAGKPVVTVSDMPGFLDRGGMIQFLVIDNRVRFSVNLRPVERSGVSLSSELLKVALSVKSEPGGEGAR